VPRERALLRFGLAAPAPAFGAELVEDFRAPLDLLAAPFALAPADVDFRAVPLERGLLALRAPPDLRAELPRDEDDDDEVPADEPELALAIPSIDHLPDITRCAASATASAISEPSLVALATTLLAA
jgi:hypothetical protein